MLIQYYFPFLAVSLEYNRTIFDGREVLCPQCPVLMDFRESLPEFYLVATSLEIMKTYHVADWESTGREAGLTSACENREGLWSE